MSLNTREKITSPFKTNKRQAQASRKDNMSNNYVRITSDDGQEVICKNFSQLFECLTGVNEKLLPDKFKVQICEDDWEFYDFPLNQQTSEQKG